MDSQRNPSGRHSLGKVGGGRAPVADGGVRGPGEAEVGDAPAQARRDCRGVEEHRVAHHARAWVEDEAHDAGAGLALLGEAQERRGLGVEGAEPGPERHGEDEGGKRSGDEQRRAEPGGDRRDRGHEERRGQVRVAGVQVVDGAPDVEGQQEEEEPGEHGQPEEPPALHRPLARGRALARRATGRARRRRWR